MEDAITWTSQILAFIASTVTSIFAPPGAGQSSGVRGCGQGLGGERGGGPCTGHGGDRPARHQDSQGTGR